jgi:hypothetical protein
MFRKLTLIFLILSLPIQAWAVSDMQFKHQPEVVGVEAHKSSHSCHQELKLSKAESSASQNQSQDSGCNSCVLCMAFAPYSYQLSINKISYSLTSNFSDISFNSNDTSGLIKPPIL